VPAHTERFYEDSSGLDDDSSGGGHVCGRCSGFHIGLASGGDGSRGVGVCERQDEAVRCTKGRVGYDDDGGVRGERGDLGFRIYEWEKRGRDDPRP
jgi:hypothetical protein